MNNMSALIAAGVTRLDFMGSLFSDLDHTNVLHTAVGGKRMRSITILICCVALGACTNADTPDGTATADTTTAGATQSGPYLRGVVLRGSAPAFVPCGTADTLRLNDPTQAIARVPVGRDADAIFAVVAGGIMADSVVDVERVVYASADRGECYNVWDTFDYRATGSSPGWIAEVNGSDVRLRREGDLNFSWSNVRKDSADGRVRYTAPAVNGGAALELLLEQSPCTNPTTGAWSLWMARAAVGGDELRGCAVPGR